jgi:glycosyltransferase involved in cell wall biosynthesis
MISIVLPALDEENAIVGTIDQLRAVLGGPDTCEIIVVDDGSQDRTAELASERGVRVVRHVHNLGYGRSLKDGISAASHDTVVIADADGSYPIDSIPALLAEFKKGYDLVVGARREYGEDSWLKLLMRLFLKWFVEFTAGREVIDVNSGLRVLSKSTVLPDLPLLSDSFSFTTSLTLCYMLTGRFVSYVPIAYHRRIGKSKVRLVRDSLRTLQFIMQTVVYFNPLKAFLLPCLACLALSGLTFLAATAGWPGALMTGVEGILAALVIFAMGLLAVMMRQRPRP